LLPKAEYKTVALALGAERSVPVE